MIFYEDFNSVRNENIQSIDIIEKDLTILFMNNNIACVFSNLLLVNILRTPLA